MGATVRLSTFRTVISPTGFEFVTLVSSLKFSSLSFTVCSFPNLKLDCINICPFTSKSSWGVVVPIPTCAIRLDVMKKINIDVSVFPMIFNELWELWHSQLCYCSLESQPFQIAWKGLLNRLK